VCVCGGGVMQVDRISCKVAVGVQLGLGGARTLYSLLVWLLPVCKRGGCDASEYLQR
jgi:hypothetical protein